METERRGRKKIFTAREIQEHKNKYGRETEWYCVICNNGKNYAMRGKHQHLKTEYHRLHMRIHELENV